MVSEWLTNLLMCVVLVAKAETGHELTLPERMNTKSVIINFKNHLLDYRYNSNSYITPINHHLQPRPFLQES